MNDTKQGPLTKEKGDGFLSDAELRLVSEMLKDSSRSDRQLGKVLGVSQPTVSKIKAGLERKGVISEYTIIPNFVKLGYQLFALTFFSWNKSFNSKEMEEARKLALEEAPSAPSNVVVIERGIGLKHDSFMASFHKDYSSYVQLVEEVKKNPYVDTSRIESFLVDLNDNIHYRYLTFSTLAKHVLEKRTGV